MKERPIIFGGESIRSIMVGAKTQTRRVVKRRGRDDGQSVVISPRDGYTPVSVADQFPCPYGVPGDRLWVRETHFLTGSSVPIYRADYPTNAMQRGLENLPSEQSVKWKPSIYMPRWASRLTLEITGVRVERLQEISEEDAIAEGLEISNDGLADIRSGRATARIEYARLWDSINGKRFPWSSNPWVWAVEFVAARTEGREG